MPTAFSRWSSASEVRNEFTSRRTPFGSKGTTRQGAALDDEAHPGWDDVHVVALDARPLRHGHDRELRGARQDVGEAALVLRREVLHDDVGEAAVRQDALEEALERLEAARRRADAHDEETLALRGAPLGFLRVARG